MKAGRTYNADMLAFLTEYYPKLFINELVYAFNKKFGKTKTRTQIQSCLSNHGIKAGVRRNRTPRRYQDNHLLFLQEHYTKMNLLELTGAFNQKFKSFNADIKSIRACLRNHKIKSGRSGCFEKGQEPWNKNMKGLQLGGEAGWFKKGAIPINYKPIGSERVNTEGYIEVKVSDPNIWKLKHRIVYEQNFKALEHNELVTFRDNNSLNCEPENLMKITRSQHAVINKMGLANVMPSAKQTATLLADLVIKTNKRQTEI